MNQQSHICHVYHAMVLNNQNKLILGLVCIRAALVYTQRNELSFKHAILNEKLSSIRPHFTFQHFDSFFIRSSYHATSPHNPTFLCRLVSFLPVCLSVFLAFLMVSRNVIYHSIRLNEIALHFFPLSFSTISVTFIQIKTHTHFT